MDPSSVNNIYALAAVCVMTLGGFFGGIAYTRKTAEPPSNNGNGKYATKDYVEARVSQHEIHCGQAEDIKRVLERLENKIDGLVERRTA